ncbi:MAG: hypothetical protein K0Q95_433 [Bacteroidota bacterium]|jgi:hypothetical protein|nr:hypothetical protein [Bacteroidota bacterium]
MDSSEIKIPINKSHLALTILKYILIMSIGIWFITSPPQLNTPILDDRAITTTFGITILIIFGFFAFFSIKKLHSNLPGLTISNKGICDNGKGLGNEVILWSDISEIDKQKVGGELFIKVSVINPHHYINLQKSTINKNLLLLNLQKYNAPFMISCKTLKCSPEELKLLLDKSLSTFNHNPIS